MQRNISNIYVSIFGIFLQFWRLKYKQKTQPTFYISFYNIQFNNNMMKIADIYVSITGYFFLQINIHQCRKNIQHYMLAFPLLYSKIS